jgi:hypothetical protein
MTRASSRAMIFFMFLPPKNDNKNDEPVPNAKEHSFCCAYCWILERGSSTASQNCFPWLCRGSHFLDYITLFVQIQSFSNFYFSVIWARKTITAGILSDLL